MIDQLGPVSKGQLLLPRQMARNFFLSRSLSIRRLMVDEIKERSEPSMNGPYLRFIAYFPAH